MRRQGVAAATATTGATTTSPVMDTVLKSAVAKIVHFCTTEETKRELETRVFGPLLACVGERFAWAAHLFQIVGVLVLVQTVLLLWLLVRDARRAC